MALQTPIIDRSSYNYYSQVKELQLKIRQIFLKFSENLALFLHGQVQTASSLILKCRIHYLEN